MQQQSQHGRVRRVLEVARTGQPLGIENMGSPLASTGNLESRPRARSLPFSSRDDASISGTLIVR
jgi:hypothetical protein